MGRPHRCHLTPRLTCRQTPAQACTSVPFKEGFTNSWSVQSDFGERDVLLYEVLLIAPHSFLAMTRGMVGGIVTFNHLSIPL